jgi:hypothetical protein
MTDAQDSIPDRFWPPESRVTGVRRATRWVIWLIVVAVLLVAIFAFYAWFIGSGTRHVQPLTGPVSGMGNDASADSTQIAAAQALAGAELAGSDANAAAPLPAVANLGDITDPDQRLAVCSYLTAEFGRLSYEFHQPLPPPVVDRIATEIAQLRGQVDHYSCGAPSPADAASNAPAAPSRNSAGPQPVEVPAGAASN